MCNLEITCNLKASMLPWILAFHLLPLAVEWMLGQPSYSSVDEGRPLGMGEQ